MYFDNENQQGIELDEFQDKRNVENGTCKNRKKFNTAKAWCQSCDPKKLIQEFMGTGNEALDEFFKDLWLLTDCYTGVIEWIPFEDFNDMQEIGRGGFSTVYSAILSNGLKEIKADENGKYVIQSRGLPKKLALKNLTNSQNLSDDFLKEIKSHLKCSNLELFGITQNPRTEDYVMVTKFADEGDLRSYIALNFKQLKWADKLFLLYNIANNLQKIHQEGYIHRDLHSRNILQQRVS